MLVVQNTDMQGREWEEETGELGPTHEMACLAFCLPWALSSEDQGSWGGAALGSSASVPFPY